MISKSLLFIGLLLSLFCWTSLGQILQARKIVEKETSHNYKVTISSRASGGTISKVTIVDNLPETISKTSGELTAIIKDVGANWKNHSYHIKVSVPKHEFSLDNKTLELELPPATLSYSINEQKEEITTDPVSISVELKDFVLIQGGWFINNSLISNLVVGFVTLVFPIVAAINFINFAHQSALGTKSK